jgi:hypothetical protein
MPFYGFTSIPDPKNSGQKCEGVLKRWLIRERDIVESGEIIAEIEICNKTFDLIICFPACVEKFLVKEKEQVLKNQNILKWIADGESIPYGKPYFKTREVVDEK